MAARSEQPVSALLDNLPRMVNTLPALVVRCEAADQSGLDKLKEAVRRKLDASGAEIPDDF